MLEITKKQFLSFDEVNRVRILQEIAKGKIKFIGGITNDTN